ncbi:tripartite tricarboxylate transporter substrate binding protein [Pseudooceanicola sp. 216_PA32_1]|uniref:Tripartite tricarboxylate transporter substrate binding protein n=1 Tax=Pseudooceanicola pacificus TaxID=2676438 RepID=A0A844WG44_9RHOB|nr:tripartite tricarboxylate transporter substrate binding protein [Pseudooceanicola pacificus]MWB79670.1 tripartite tricarboxylate transporter substrate binding protein [Pseudooceanicola pacificus]
MKKTLTALALALAATTALADYPEKPVEIIVGYSAGGGTDVMARTVAQFLEKELGDGASVVVKNMPGAGGQIGFTETSQAAPDGYTLGTFNLPAALALTYDRDADYDVSSFTYLANFVEDPNTITVAASSKFQTLDELIEAAKADPGAITLGLSSLGGNDHFGANMMAAASGAEFTLVPFKGASNARTAIMGGHVAAGTMTLGQTTSFPDELRVLAVLAEDRSPFRPDVPTAKELGYDVQMSSLRGIVAPAGLDAAVADKLRAALSAVNANPEFQAMMAEQGNPIAFVVGDDFAATAAKQNDVAAQIWAETPWK